MSRRILVATVTLALGLVIIARNAEPLPEGNGLAARYPGDLGIESDPAVIFADSFESYTSGTELWGNWSNIFQTANIRIATESNNVHGGSKALEFTIPVSNQDVANAVQKLVSPELDVLFLRYYAKFNKDFDVLGSSHNGGIISAHYCCPGVVADGYNKFLVSYEASRWETSTGNPGLLNAYVYHPDQRSPYGDHFHPTGVITPYSTNPPFTFGQEFVARPDITPELGRWYAYELMVKANTPGLRDGRIAMWLDGNLIAEFTNLRLRETTSLKINGFELDLYAGSNTSAVAREWYDNVVAATSYIGPMVSASSNVPGAPTGVRIVRQ
jgi:hypothetical protein